jgi:hypothetical protein
MYKYEAGCHYCSNNELYENLQFNITFVDFDDSVPISAEVKTMCIYTSIPPYVFMV